MEIWLLEQEKASSPEFLSKTWNYSKKKKWWEPWVPFPSQMITHTFSVEQLKQISTGSTQLPWFQNSETLVIMIESMMLFFLMGTLMCLPLHPSTKFVSGMPRTDKSCWESKSLDLSVIVFSLCRMGSRLFRAGLMGKLGLFCRNLANFSMLSTMLIIMDALLSLPLRMEKELYQVEQKGKSESGELPSKLRWWRLPSKNIEVGFGPSKSTKIIPRQSVQVEMDRASSGTSKTDPAFCACSSQQSSSKPSSTHKSTRYWQPEPITKSPTGRNMMDRLSDRLRAPKKNSIPSISPEKANISLLEDKMVSWGSGTMMKECAIMKEKGIRVRLSRWESPLIKKQSFLSVHKVPSSSGVLPKKLWKLVWNQNSLPSLGNNKLSVKNQQRAA